MVKSAEAFRTISEVAEWLGTPAHVLRFWESKFPQIKPVKRAGGRRYYRPKDMLLIGGVKKLLHEDGMTIRGAQRILRDKGISHVAALSQPLDDASVETQDVQTVDTTEAVPQSADSPSSGADRVEEITDPAAISEVEDVAAVEDIASEISVEDTQQNAEVEGFTSSTLSADGLTEETAPEFKNAEDEGEITDTAADQGKLDTGPEQAPLGEERQFNLWDEEPPPATQFRAKRGRLSLGAQSQPESADDSATKAPPNARDVAHEEIGDALEAELSDVSDAGTAEKPALSGTNSEEQSASVKAPINDPTLSIPDVNILSVIAKKDEIGAAHRAEAARLVDKLADIYAHG